LRSKSGERFVRQSRKTADAAQDFYRRDRGGWLVGEPGLRRIGASQAAYSSRLIPLVALTVSTVCEGYVWHPNAVAGLAMILAGNLVMFARPSKGVSAAQSRGPDAGPAPTTPNGRHGQADPASAG
jgi:hypothetical protein